jgi:hypothetical protein
MIMIMGEDCSDKNGADYCCRELHVGFRTVIEDDANFQVFSRSLCRDEIL